MNDELMTSEVAIFDAFIWHRIPHLKITATGGGYGRYMQWGFGFGISIGFWFFALGRCGHLGVLFYLRIPRVGVDFCGESLAAYFSLLCFVLGVVAL